MKEVIKTLHSCALSIALKDYVQTICLRYPQSLSVQPTLVDDLVRISDSVKNAYSVEIVINHSADDDKESIHE